jgi:hypothetical protein
MKIGIIGAGNIGGTLGGKWVMAGHTVTFGVRDANSPKTQALRQAIPEAVLASPGAAAEAGEVILLALPHAATTEFLYENAVRLAGKLVIDATNNFNAAVVSSIPAIQAAAPTARPYRAFNSLGWEVFAKPVVGGVQADHFFCGADGADRKLVEGLIAAVGVRPVWVGGLETLTAVDALGTLWVTLAFRRGLGRQIAIKLLE